MNRFLSKLSASGQKDYRLILGLMSGTSLDGLDMALCLIRGSGTGTRLELVNYTCASYSEAEKATIRRVFSRQSVDLVELCLLNEEIGRLHAALINQTLFKWNVNKDDIDCIASHGQTVFHAPQRLHRQTGRPDSTLQIGDGDHIAMLTGIPTLCDFRQKHIAAGGEGAPLALYGDYLLFSHPTQHRILLNIGGIANFTFLPARQSLLDVICSDTGPGNGLSDLLMKEYYHAAFDEDGRVASSGSIDQPLLAAMLGHPFFSQSLPKTTGPELFNWQFIAEAAGSGLEKIKPQDLVSTVIRLSAESIAKAVRTLPVNDGLSMYVSGGGAKNSTLMAALAELLPGITVRDSASLGIDGDAKEAALFAVLANETLCGSSVDNGAGPAITMGKICLPL